MIIDSSAILAIVFSEADGLRLLDAMYRAESRRISAATWLETFVVFDRRQRPAGVLHVEELLSWIRPEIVSVTTDQARVARAAYELFGRGHHPARLNYGDCFAYALAKTTGEPLLFKGNDFSQTDIEPALKT